MKQLKWLALALLFASCQKELSGEDEVIVPQGCMIDRISQIDTTTNTSLGFVGITFNNASRVIRLEDYDSVNNDHIVDASFTLAGDTVKLSAHDYYIVDPANNLRVRASQVDGDYFGLTDEDIFFNYTYDAGGYLISKAYSLLGQDLFRFDYLWTGGNLTRVVARIPFTGEILYEADMSYYTNIAVKDFLHLAPDIIDSYFDIAMNFGKKSANALNTVTITEYDASGNPSTYITTFYNYQLDAENRVMSYVVDNANLSDFGIYEGKNQVRYRCR